MKKCIIVTALAGFVRSFLMEDILTLQLMGYEVHCASNAYHNGAEGIQNFFVNKGIIFHQVDFSSDQPFSYKSMRSFCQLRKILKQEEFDIVHCHTPIAGAICRLCCLSLGSKAKIIYTTHGFYFHSKSSKQAWLVYYPVEKILSFFTDIIITINKEDYKNAKRMNSKQVYYIPGVGVDIEKYHNIIIDRNKYRQELEIKENAFVILSIGELSKRKNQDIIVKAIAETSLKNVVYVICGNVITNPKIKDDLINDAKKMNVDLRLLGLRNDIPEICKCADIGVLPSLREGLGLAGIEILSADVPLIGANVQGIKDYIIDGYNGYLVDPTDVNGFRDAILRMYDNQTRYTLQKNCWMSVQKFDISQSRQIMKKIYETCEKGLK